MGGAWGTYRGPAMSGARYAGAILTLGADRSHGANLLALSLVSAALTGYLFLIGYTQFPGGAEHFTIWAEGIAAGYDLPMTIAQRQVGFPVLLWLTGYPYHHSLLPTLIAHAFMAFLMPLLTYWMLAPASRAAGVLLAALMMASFVPYQMMKFVHHDMTHIFLLFLSAAIAAHFAATQKWRYFFLAVAVATFCALARPISIFVVPVYIGVMAVYDIAAGHFRAGQYVKRIAMYGVGVLIWLGGFQADHMHRAAIFGFDEDKPEVSYTATQLFYPMYVDSVHLGYPITRDLGPRTDAFYDYLIERFSPEPTQQGVVSSLLSIMPEGSDFADRYVYGLNPEEFVESIFAHPNQIYLHFMTDDFADHPELNGYLWGVMGEMAREHPRYIARYSLGNLFNYLFRPGRGHSMWNANPGGPQELQFLLRGPNIGNAEIMLGPLALSELQFVPLEGPLPQSAEWLRAATDHYERTYPTVNTITIWPTLLGCLLCCVQLLLRTVGRLLGRPALGAALPSVFPRIDACMLVGVLSLGLIMYHALVTAIAVDPYYRYHIITMPLQITAAGVGLILLCDLAVQGFALARRRGLPGAAQAAAAAQSVGQIRIPYVGGAGRVSVPVAAIGGALAFACVFSAYALYLYSNL